MRLKGVIVTIDYCQHPTFPKNESAHRQRFVIIEQPARDHNSNLPARRDPSNASLHEQIFRRHAFAGEITGRLPFAIGSFPRMTEVELSENLGLALCGESMFGSGPKRRVCQNYCWM